MASEDGPAEGELRVLLDLLLAKGASVHWREHNGYYDVVLRPFSRAVRNGARGTHQCKEILGMLPQTGFGMAVPKHEGSQVTYDGFN